MNEERGCLPLLHKAPAERLPHTRTTSALIPPLRPIVPTFRHRPTLGLLLAGAVLAATAPAPALGASYGLSGTSFPACAGGSWTTSGDTHTCSGSIALAAGDTIIPSKKNSVLVANAGITLAGNSQLGSNLRPLTVRTTWGSIQISGSGNTMYGDLESSSGAISISGSSHTGSITTNGAASIVASTVDGTVSAQNGIQTTNAEITGSLTATSGSISLSGGSVGGEVRSGCCSISANSSDLLGGATAHSGLAVSGGSIAGNFSLTALNAASFTSTTMSSGSISGASTITFNNSRIGIQAPISATAGTGEITVTNGSTVYGSLSAPHYSSVRVTSGSFVYGTCSPIKTDLGFCGEASCSPFLGQATINEVHQIGQNNWIEVKVFDSSTDYGGWTLRSCAASGNKTECGTYALAGIGLQNGHYIVVDVDMKHIDVHQSKSMSATLFDGSGKEIDFLNVNNFGVSTPNCPFVFDTVISTTSSNLKGVARLPDGTGEWEELSAPGNTDPGTIGDSNTPGATIDHIRIEHHGQGLTCAVTTLTIKACANESCSSLHTAGGITGTLSASEGGVYWTEGNAAFSIGASGYTTKDVQPATTTWGLASANPPPTTGYKCDNTSDGLDANADTQCQFSATRAGFIVSHSRTGNETEIPSQIAGITSDTYYLRAVESSTNNPAVCTPAIVNQSNVGVTFAYACNDPSTCAAGHMLVVNSTEMPSSGASVNLDFDGDGSAPITLRYDDVGRITVNASKTLTPEDGTAVTLTGSTNAFVVKPYAFRLHDLACADGDNPSPDDGAFCVAGGTFTGKVEAVRYDPSAAHNLGGVTPSFGHESPPQTVTFEPAALINPTSDPADPVDDFAPSSTGSFGGISNHAIATMVWPNVGTIRIKPTMNYLGAGDLTAAGRNDSIAFAGNVGRFYPHHFALSAGSIRPACMDGSFTYMDQPSLGITFTIEARNKANEITTNYFAAPTGGYAHLATVAVVAEDVNSATDLGSRIGGLGMPNWTAGEYAIDVENAMFSRSFSPDGPFNELAIGVKVVDGVDKAPLADTNMTTTPPGDCTMASVCDAVRIGSETQMRFGRLRLANVYGYYSPLEMAVEAQYWSGNSWVRNLDDNCTVIENDNLAALKTSDPAAHETGWTLTAPPGTLDGGRGKIELTRTADAARSARICVDLGADPASGVDCDASAGNNLPWLQGKWPPGTGHDNDPWATATFGIFRQEGRKGIYNRELY